jgi:hypothetical protein
MHAKVLAMDSPFKENHLWNLDTLRHSIVFATETERVQRRTLQLTSDILRLSPGHG